MGQPTKIRTVRSGDVTEIRMLITHPMESGRRKDAAGQLVPAHFVETLVVTVNGRLLVDAQLNTAIARNPVFAFRARNLRPGDRIAVTWKDNRGDSRTDEAVIG